MGTRKNCLTEAVLTSTHNLCLRAKIRKIGIPQFCYIKVGFKGVYITCTCFPDAKKKKKKKRHAQKKKKKNTKKKKKKKNLACRRSSSQTSPDFQMVFSFEDLSPYDLKFSY